MSGNLMNQPFLDLGNKIQIIVKFLRPNTVLACPTYDEAGSVVHPAYTPFTQEDINNLLKSKIEKIYYSKKTRGVEPLYAKDLREYLDNKVYTGPRTISLDTQKKASEVAEKIVETVKKEASVDFIQDTKDVINCVLRDIDHSHMEIINLLDIQAYDDFTYTHCLNVGVIAMMFARKLGMDEEIVKDIGLASFLHDIGKIRLPYDLINKMGILSEEEFDLIKKHSRYGYEIVKKSTELSETVKKIILLHHEKYDGTGYPFGLKDNQIDDVVYVVALAEFYDALTTELTYKRAFSNNETLNLIVRNSGKHFKPELAHHFINEMSMFFKESSYFPIGSYVLLNTYEVAKVVSKRSELTSRPGVEILKNKDGKKLSHPIPVDLEMDGSRHVLKVIKFEEKDLDELEKE